MSSKRVKEMQRLPKNLGSLQCAPMPLPRFGERPKKPWNIATYSNAYAEVLRGIGAMVSSHHDVPMEVRYNGAMQCEWHWFV